MGRPRPLVNCNEKDRARAPLIRSMRRLELDETLAARATTACITERLMLQQCAQRVETNRQTSLHTKAESYISKNSLRHRVVLFLHDCGITTNNKIFFPTPEQRVRALELPPLFAMSDGFLCRE